MINLNQLDSRVIEALAVLAENNGRPDRAAALREVIRQRAEAAAEAARAVEEHDGYSTVASRRRPWQRGPHG